MSAIQFRPYQQESVDRIRESFRSGKRAPLLVSPTGSGKTRIFSGITEGAAAKGNRVLILVHRAELLDQTTRALTALGVPHGCVAAGRTPTPRELVQVASVQTLVRRLDIVKCPDLIILDECFPAGTLVEGRPIETLAIGDEMTTHLGKGAVTHVFKKRPTGLLTIKAENGHQITCTPEHPVWTQDGFKEANALTTRDRILTITPDVHVRHLLSTNQNEETLRQAGVPIGILEADNSGDILTSQRGNYSVSEDQRDAQSRDEGEGLREIAGNGLEAYGPKGQRLRTVRGSSSTCESVEMGDGSCDPNQDERVWLSNLLQGGHWKPAGSSRGRGGWQFALSGCAQSSRPEEGRVFTFHRVESVQVHEPTSCGTFGGLCPDGFVYNLEVSNGNTFTANGVLVHNCHHAAAGSWLKVLKHYNSRILGVTATPERLDGKGLGDVFDDLIRGPEVADLIEQGYLCKPVYYAPGNVDLSGVRTTAGDYNKGDLKKALDKPKIVGSAIEHYTRICPGVPAIAFCCSIELATRTAAEFNGAGYRFEVIDGTLDPAKRRELVRKLGTGELHGLASCDIVSEGFDLPVVTAAILLRPTQSLSLHLQQIGRVLRPHPTKTHAIIIDHVGNVGSKQGTNWIPKHGGAEERREWTLEGTTSKRKKQLGSDVRNRQCPECYGVHGIAPICPLCGHEYVIAERRPEEIEGDLTELSPEAMAAASMARKIEQGRAKTLPELIAIGKSRGFRNPAAWAGHILRSRGMRGAAA
jgi:superfamily II DNA or RNA helicase